MRRLAPVAVAVLALAAAGCGATTSDSSEDLEGEAQVVAVAIEDLEEAGREDDARMICEDLLADELLASLRQAGTDCVDAVDEALEDADQFDLDVEAVRVRGTRAAARVTSGGGDDEETDTLMLVRDGRQWKIASLGGGAEG